MLKEFLISIMLGKSANEYAKSGKALNNKHGISKSSMYRFMSATSFSWRSFHIALASIIVERLSKLTDSNTIKTFIIDDSVIDRSRSKHTELLAKVFDHCSHKYLKGFCYLPLAWSDGISTIITDFAMMSSKKDENCINKIAEDKKDARKAIYKRMIESRKSKPEVVVELIKRAIKKALKLNMCCLILGLPQSH